MRKIKNILYLAFHEPKILKLIREANDFTIISIRHQKGVYSVGYTYKDDFLVSFTYGYIENLSFSRVRIFVCEDDDLVEKYQKDFHFNIGNSNRKDSRLKRLSEIESWFLNCMLDYKMTNPSAVGDNI